MRAAARVVILIIAMVAMMLPPVSVAVADELPGSVGEVSGSERDGSGLAELRARDSNVAESGRNGLFVEDEVIVRFGPGASAAGRAAARFGISATVRRNLLLSRTQLLTIPPGLTVEQAVEQLERHPAVRYAEPNFIIPLSAVPDDTDFAELWGLHNTGQNVNGTTGTADADIDAPEAWDITQGSTDVLVGIIDSGIAYDHPDLAPNLWVNPGESGGGKETNGVDDDSNGFVDDWRGWDFLNDDNDPRDFSGHGTHVAGIIGARGNNDSGITGVSQQVSMVMAQACDANGCLSSDLVDSFTYVAGLGARMTNASLSGTTFSQAQFDAIAANPNTLYVVAAGNGGVNNDTTPHYPCAYDLANILCVAATDSDDAPAGFSNFGVTSVDLAAPGVNIYSTFPSYTTRFDDDFESGDAGWTSGGVNNTWNIIECTVEGLHCWTDSPPIFSSYANNTDSWIETVSNIDVSTGVAECQAIYPLALDTQAGFDGLFVEASSDLSVWTVLDAWTGSTGGFFIPIYTPVDSAGGLPIYLRYRLVSNPSVVDDGAYILSVEVRCVDTTTTTYEYLSGTSMATAYATGAAALLQSAAPSITAAEMKTILMDTVDPLAVLSGITVSGGRLNAHQAVLAALPNTAPVASDDDYDAVENTQLIVGAAAGVLDNDTDADPLTVSDSDTTSSEGGSVAVAADGSFTYDPPADFSGTDTFGYTASDGTLTDTATVTITVAAPPPSGGGGGGGGGGGILPQAPALEACPDTLADPGFTDLGGISAEASHAVACLVAYEITEGTSATTFSPMLSVTRWQMALFLIRQASVHGVPLPAVAQHGFTDIGGLPSTTQDAINQLATLEITEGTSATTFDPFADVSRWQMALFLTRMADLVGVPLPVSPNGLFLDVAGLTAETQLAINQLAEIGIAKGTSSTTFDPFADVLRWQMALFLTRLLEADGVLPE